MNDKNIDIIRKKILEELSDSEGAISTIFDYCTSPFDYSNLKSPVFPMKRESHVDDWERYISGRDSEHLEALREKIPNLNIPIREGISKTDAYADVARRGKPFNEEKFGGRLGFDRPDLFRVEIHEHPAGALPILITSEWGDFKKLFRVLGAKCEPAPLQRSVNAQMIAGFINWDRVHCYREEWEKNKSSADTSPWSDEMKRVAKEEGWRFRDRFIIICENPYSNVTAKELGLDMDEDTWKKKSTLLRVEHEFTHYTTKRLYNEMHNNLLDETLADFMGITAALGTYRAKWYLTFLGLENWPEIREGGRIFTYSEGLDDDAFTLLCRLVVKAAAGLEIIHKKNYDNNQRGRFLLALTFMTLELIASDRTLFLFEERYNKAGHLTE